MRPLLVLAAALVLTSALVLISAKLLNSGKPTAKGDVAGKGCQRSDRSQPVKDPKRAILFKTHKFSKAIRDRYEKVVSESKGLADVFLVVHGDVRIDGEEQRLFRVSDEELHRVYDRGFVDPWLSNHWLLMSWWKRVGRAGGYQFVWSVEYDVGIVGNSAVLWGEPSGADLIASYGPFRDSAWPYKDRYFCDKATSACLARRDEDKWYGYVQISRYSARFLDYMDHVFESGENGQDEMMIFSLAKKGQFSIDTEAIACRQGFWSAQGADAALAKKAYMAMAPAPSLTLFHPIKD
jgi:hypothetical protein